MFSFATEYASTNRNPWSESIADEPPLYQHQDDTSWYIAVPFPAMLPEAEQVDSVPPSCQYATTLLAGKDTGTFCGYYDGSSRQIDDPQSALDSCAPSFGSNEPYPFCWPPIGFSCPVFEMQPYTVYAQDLDITPVPDTHSRFPGGRVPMTSLDGFQRPQVSIPQIEPFTDITSHSEARPQPFFEIEPWGNTISPDMELELRPLDPGAIRWDVVDRLTPQGVPAVMNHNGQQSYVAVRSARETPGESGTLNDRSSALRRRKYDQAFPRDPSKTEDNNTFDAVGIPMGGKPVDQGVKLTL